jgi:integration host factor subunit alpha|tara:strand:+ start:1137 stop:1424 length:288 start_codon:yes stop_codon:yes gene_type:complete
VISKNITKADLAKNLSKKLGFSITFSKKLIDDLLDVLSLSIKANKLKLKNIGSFRLINKKQRLGRNPKTKETYVINARKSLSFIVSKKLIKKTNN